jgi:DNA polymerase III subunit alpha, Gram-positive type
MKIMSIDIELNQLNGAPKVIEIGAAVYNVKDGALLATFHTYVDPGESITQFITDLTGITDDKVKGAPNIREAYLRLKEFYKKNHLPRMPLVWGSGTRNDSSTIHEQSGVEEQNFMGFRVLDVKTLYQSFQIISENRVKGGLSTACDNFQLGWDDRFGSPHRALADAHNTFILWYHMIKRFKKGFEQ